MLTQLRVSRLLSQLSVLLLGTVASAHVAIAQSALAMVQSPPGVIQRAPATVQSGPAMVVLVRHAEKATTGGNDPSLSELGQARAKALVLALNDAGVSAVITTQYKRTGETGEAVATARNLKLEKIAITGTTAAHIEAMVAAIRKHPGEVVLVVGHSNTIPAIVTALGGPKLPDLCDANYATMFVMHLGKDGTAAHVVRTRYGAADPDGAETCAGSTMK
ncbi:MAG: histidine phosphatase family protein [Gemmatimonadaceae bacterium]